MVAHSGGVHHSTTPHMYYYPTRTRSTSTVGRVLQRAKTIDEAEETFSRRNVSRRDSTGADSITSSHSDTSSVEGKSPPPFLASIPKRCDSNNNVMRSSCDEELDELPKPFAWDWPFCDEGVARGVYTDDKFMICLPFSNGGTGETSGSTKKFEKISESNFSWTVGLSNASDFGTGFWRMELETIPSLNMLILIVSRDISRAEDRAKRLKRVRKVYRLPDIYDVSTLTSTSYDWAIVIEALRRRDIRTNRYVPLRRSDTFH
ncbi:Protein Y55D5A.4 [Aphelenchoides avenae]|nr:Protein Y55D5A.4 [Aphelenchus avenae]